MCGIAGAIGHVGSEVLDAVRRADAAQSHRGPDGHGFWSDGDEARPGQVALAHRRLSIIDLSDAASQPMVDPASGCVLIFNGEIYNFRRLKHELASAGYRFTSSGDTEVLLKAYLHWGPDFVSRLAGMFTFAIWDPRSRRLVLARDRLGIKPLYVARVSRGGENAVLFASEVRALLKSGLVDRRIDPAGLASFLWHGFVFGPSTLIADIALVPAGCRLILTPDGGLPEPEPFWRLPRAGDGPSTSTAVLEAELERAVQDRLVSDVPLGVFLSGGIDSSAVAAMASVRDPERIHTFNVGFEEADYDESVYAAKVAEQLGTQHTSLTLTGADFANRLDDAFTGIDQPTFDGLNSYFVSRAVREAGVTVALAGTGGDELFGGYASFVDLPKAADVSGRLSSVPDGMLRLVAGVVTRVKTGRPGVLPPQTRWGKLPEVLTSGGDIARGYQIAYSLFTPTLLEQLMPDHAQSGTVHGIPRERWSSFQGSIDGRTPLDAVSTLELQSFITERLLRDTDAAAMAVSLEVRVPLLDHDFVAAVAGADEDARYRPIRKKQLLRYLALRRLDPNIFDRPKSGFVMPFEVWCRKNLRDDIRTELTDASSVSRVGLDPDTVAKVWQAVDENAPGFYWSRLWSLYTLVRWCREHEVSR